MNDTIPEELAAAVRRAAATAPATVADLGGLRQRYRRRQRRRVAASAGLAAALVGAAATTAPLLARGRTADGQPSAPVAISQSAPQISLLPPQRLLLAQFDGLQPPPSSGVSVGEVLPDGTVVFRPLSAVDIADRVVPLPDSRLVVLGSVDLTPGVIEQPDGPFNPAAGFMLVRQRDDGSVELSRNVRVIGEDVQLLGATDSVAYLLRPTGLVEHDFATGHERLLLLPSAALPTGPPTGRAVDIAGGRIAFADAACRVHLFALGTGTLVTTLGPLPNCTAPGEVRLSPDGRLAAFSYSIGSVHAPEPIQTRLAVLDVATGATKLDMLVFNSVWDTAAGQGASIFSTRPYYLQGMAWSTPESLLMAIAHNGTLSVQPVTVP